MTKLATKPTLNDASKLSIKDFKQQLKEREEPTGVTITYKLAGGQAQQQAVAITTTPCTYGGVRYWWQCPTCEQRAAVLYFKDGYSCRECTGLTYKTQLQQPIDRAFRRVAVIRAALGWAPGIANGHGPKPRGMWHSTFNALVTEHDSLAKQITNEIKGTL